jgi:hypothetical protein
MEDDAFFNTIEKVIEMCNRTPIKWTGSINSGNLEAIKAVPFSGLGQLGIFSLGGKIIQNGSKFDYSITATCLPLSSDNKGSANSLGEAKRLVEEEMSNQAGALASILLSIPKG